MSRELILVMGLLVLAGCMSAPGVCVQAAQKPTKAQPAAKPARKPAAQKPARAAATKPATTQSEFEAMSKLPPAERVPRLQSFIETNPPAALKTRAVEHLISARAALADERLQAGDVAGGVEEFKQAVALAPADMPDKLFVEVVSQFPANLFLRGQTEAAFAVARLIEAKVQTSPQRLLALAAFYLNIEQVDEAARLAEAARTLAPDMASAHQALGAAHRLSLRLDEATAEYKRALELDPKSALSRRNLADLLRATGKPTDALALYREQLTIEPADRFAQTGVVLSLLDAAQHEDAERELAAALNTEPNNLPLLVGASYWFAAHGDGQRALDLAGRAVALEPRYTWAQIAAARALVAQKHAFDAERALRFARQYGRFPTLDYELASALAAAGLYEEAAEELAHTFTLKDGQLETQLAGRVPARATNFVELLAPERRASIFQYAAADTDANARTLKGLLALHLALNAPTADEATTAAAARDFAAGDDDLRAFRQLYAADRLSRRGVALTTAAELAEAAKGSLEAAANTSVASVALAADELRLMRARAINAGGTPDFPTVPREALTRIMRGRTEELIGWSLFNQNKPAEAVTALRRAVSVLPEGSIYWRNAHWRLGAALAAHGQPKDALSAYLKAYDTQSPDAAQRAIIEKLYVQVNGSKSGLDALVGPAPQIISTNTETTAPAQPVVSETPQPTPVEPVAPTPTPTPTPTEPPQSSEPPTPAPENKPPERKPVDDPAPVSSPPVSTTPTPTPTPAEPTEPPPPVATPTPAPAEPATTDTKPAESTTAESTPAESKPADAKPAVVEEHKAGDENKTGAGTENKSGEGATTPVVVRVRPRRTPTAQACALTFSVDSLLLTSGASGTVSVSLEGQGSSNADITASTNAWADIVILREPQDPAVNAARYTITSVSKKSGTFIVNFKAPCGAKELAVTISKE